MRGQDLAGMVERHVTQFGLRDGARIATGPSRLPPEAAQPDKLKISGTAARFGRLSSDLGGFREVLLRGCFGDLRGRDIAVTFSGNPSQILGRTAAGTAAVWDDQDGVYFEADPPNVPWANDLIVSLDRKDIDGAAAFFVVTDGRTEYDHGEKVRVISAARLLSVAVCAFSDYMEGTAATATNNSKSSAAGSLYLPILQTQGRLQ